MSPSPRWRDGAPVRDIYHAATTSELSDVSPATRVAAIIDQRRLFPHTGEIELTEAHLRLGGWRTFSSADLVKVSLQFTSDYGRFSAGGARGGFPSFGAAKRLGAPLVLDLTSGERILALVGFTWWSGATSNSDWLPLLKDFTAQSDRPLSR